MTKQEYMKFHENCCTKMVDITKRKNSDYTGASQDPFSNFSQIGHLVQTPQVVEIGFLTRMSDKLSRIGSFITKGTLMVADESIEDTLLDLANYCILFAGYLRHKKEDTSAVVPLEKRPYAEFNINDIAKPALEKETIKRDYSKGIFSDD